MNLLERLKDEAKERLAEVAKTHPASHRSIVETLTKNKVLCKIDLDDAANISTFLNNRPYMDLRGIYDLFDFDKK